MNDRIVAPSVTAGAEPGPEEEEPRSRRTLSAGASPRRLQALQRSSNEKIRAFRADVWPDVSDAEWNDWRWQAKHRYKRLGEIERALDLSSAERAAIERGGSMLPLAITPYYMGLLDRDDPNQPLRRTVIPTARELVRTAGEADDPLGEDGHSPVPGIVHRYPDRVLFLVLDYCTTYCRYCTRSRVVGQGEISASRQRLEVALDYIRRTPTIRDVLLSGGDPLSLKDDKLDWILTELRNIPHVEFVRIGTKMPAVLPQRITDSLIRVLKKHHPLWMSIHFIHPDECTPESYEACSRLADAGIPLGAQAVLLKGVNDEVETLRELSYRLLLMRVRPYYLYQCDPISGSAHFRTSIDRAMELMRGLRGHITGYGVWTYVVDAPGGGGKIPVIPTYLKGRDGDDWILENYENNQFRYRDPIPEESSHGRRSLPTLR